MRSTRASADGDSTVTPQALLAHCDEGRLWPADAEAPADLAHAYQGALAVRALRIARGERPLGYKVGFTNRTIWQRYGVFAPIWGTVWDTTLTHCDGRGTIDLAHTCQPRIEPEIVFGISATPPVDSTLEQLFACVEWLAPGFEIVQSHCKDWKFVAPQTVADGGLHGRLLVGRKTPVRRFAASGEALDAMLAKTRVRLLRGDTPVEEGTGVNVLDGPLHALHHFVLEQQRCPGAPALAAGDIVTTGTWTDAWPVEPGQSWRSEFDAPFDGLEISFR
jgi:2-oxo-3-hexenedioate decarboxylase